MPQVTIIRSDSTSSFIPLSPTSDEQTNGDSYSGGNDGGGGPDSSQSSQKQPLASRQMVSRLAKSNQAGSSRVESEYIEANNLELDGSLVAKQQQQQQQYDGQQQVKIGAFLPRAGVDNIVLGPDEGVRAQLDSGQVPPIREKQISNRNLLDLQGQMSRLGSLADSLDNLAALIPR